MRRQSGGSRDRCGQIVRLAGQTGSGALVCLESRLARSKTASLYRTDRVGVAAKIYHRPTEDQRLKLQAMIRSTPPDPSLRPGHVSFAWPSGLLIDGSDRFIGFVMPLVERGDDAIDLLSRSAPDALAEPDQETDRRAIAAHLAFLKTILQRHGISPTGFAAEDVAVDAHGLVTLTGCDGWWAPNLATVEVLPSEPIVAVGPNLFGPVATRFEQVLARGDARLAVSLWRAESDLRRHKNAPDHVVRMRELGAALDTIDALVNATPPWLIERLSQDDLAALWRGLFYDHPILLLLDDEPPQDPAYQSAAAHKMSALLARARRDSAVKSDIQFIGQGGRRRVERPTGPDAPLTPSKRRPVGPLLAAPEPVRFVPPAQSAALDGAASPGRDGAPVEHLTYRLSVESDEAEAPTGTSSASEVDWTQRRARTLEEAFQEAPRRVTLVITPSQITQSPPIAVVNRATGAVIAECEGVSGDSPITIQFDAPTQPVTLALEYRGCDAAVALAAPPILHPPVKQRMIGPPAVRPLTGARAATFTQV